VSGIEVGKEIRIVFNGIAALGVVAGSFCIWLGYHLFSTFQANGNAAKSTTKVAAGKAVSLFISGQWPGLFFIRLGALIIIVALLAAGTGMALGNEKQTVAKKKKSATEQQR
jgi:hypothetical protein